MRPLPTPTRGGSISDLRRFVNCTDEDWPLVLGWLVAAFRVRGPFAILVILGEQGSAKSSLGRLLRRLLDPNAADLRSQSRDARDLMIAASNSWALGFDNLSSIPGWLSDAFCRLATGGGFATRSLYTDDEESIFDSQRPLILNGIENIVERSDLLDRSVVIDAPRIPRKRRRVEKKFWAAFNEARPSILGAILDAVSFGLRHESDIKLDSLPRMADFATWVVACEPALGLEPGQFMAAYERNREAQVDIGVESSLAAQAVRELIDAGETFEGTATELLEILTKRLGEKKPPTAWPKDGRQLAGELRRAAPDLRSIGIEVTFFRKPGGGRKRLIKLERRGDGDDDPPPPNEPDDHTPPDSTEPGTQQRDDGTRGSSRAVGGAAPGAKRVRDDGDGRDDASTGLNPDGAGGVGPPASACLFCRTRRFWRRQELTHWVCWNCHEPPSDHGIVLFELTESRSDHGHDGGLPFKSGGSSSPPSRPSRPQEKERDDAGDESVPPIVPAAEEGR